MAAPIVTVTCPDIEVADRDKCVRLPGGIAICATPIGEFPTNGQIARSLIGQANSALAPLIPIFNIIEAVLSVVDFAKTVPEVISNPKAVVDALEKVIETAAALASLIPQLSIPLAIIDLLDLLICALKAIRDDLTAIIAMQLKIAAAQAQAAENPTLLVQITCAQGKLDAVLASTKANIQPLGRFINIINIFMSLIGLDPIPLVELGDDASEALDALDPIIDTLETIRNAIPVP